MIGGVLHTPYQYTADQLRAAVEVVQIYNSAEALPNPINPFWMLPILGIMGLRARDLIGFTFGQVAINLPLVLVLFWLLGMTLTYHAPVIPG